MTTAEVERFGEELGFDALGITRAEAYAETERHIIERCERGLFAGMKFTMARPEESCHPETLLPGARSVLSAALCYWLPEEPPEPGVGRLARYTWADTYAELRGRLDELGRRLGGTYRVLVDANQHVDREAAARSGVGFYGKNTMLITRRHGSWVVLGTLVTDVELEPTAPLDADCGSCRLCIDACPTGALDEPGTLDATKCLSYWTQAPAAIPEPYRGELGSQVYGCDICQDVCPWNRGAEKRRSGLDESSGGHVDLVEWLEGDGQAVVDKFDRLYVPRNDPRWLRRNALVALGNTGTEEHLPLLERFVVGEDDMLAEHAAWAVDRVRARVRSSSDRPLEWWIAIVRLIAVPFAVVQVGLTSGYPTNGARDLAWAFAVVFVIGAIALYARVGEEPTRRFQLVALLFDFGIISAFTVLYAFESGTPTRQLLYLAIIAGAARFGMEGGLATAAAAVPIAAWFEYRRSHYFNVSYRVDFVTIQAGAGVLMALIVGWIVARLDEQRRTAEQRAAEAEGLRDELGRRADLLDAANRCARALSSSLDLDEAFGAFIRELRGLIPFDRMAIVLAESGAARVIATAGNQAGDVMPPGTVLSLERNLLAEVIANGTTVYREDMAEPRYAEEVQLVELGVRSRVVAPLLVGARSVGLISVGRGQPYAFEEHELELVSLLGRLAASAIQNIRAYESERRTVEELRRLSALRADFVSLVSHELRSPMATVIGAARTLQARWRELQPQQRQAFLALIADETARLSTLIGDVLDTSRLDAGTFSYTFTDVDLGALVRDSVANAAVAQDEVPIVAEVGVVEPVRADPERVRQVISNLIDNAVKYSPAGEPVAVQVAPRNSSVVIAVTDRGPGIAADDQRVIFEKFGRVNRSGSVSKPGTGLGLYIARSIAEAHGGTLEVASALGRGATFTLELPL